MDQRRLAAILAADVVGYSRLMAADEVGTLAALKARRREVIEPLVAKHHGRIFKTTGDGALVEFASAVNAVQCAVDLQQSMAAVNAGQPDDRQIILRVGVNLGDVMVEGPDLYGDGVNIAARLEGQADPGCVLISGITYDYVRNKLKAEFDDLGTLSLKNIAEPIRVYRVAGTPAVANAAAKTLADKPSIAVLPFTNMSDDPEQEYFSDGITEDIISALSRLHWLFVIARNSSFVFKGRSIDMKQAGQQLGVRYLLEGSVRKANKRVRITSQLIDTATGAHIWADRLDGALSNVFELQDQVTESVVGAIEPALRHAEIARAVAKPTESIDAYDLFLRASSCHNTYTLKGSQEALRLLERALAIDPNYALAYGLAAYCHMRQWTAGWIPVDSPGTIGESVRLARLAAKIGPDDPEALWMSGFSIAMMDGDFDEALVLIKRSLMLNPNSAKAWMASGFVRAYGGDGAAAIGDLQRATRLSPLDPWSFLVSHANTIAYLGTGDVDKAAYWADRTVHEAPYFIPGLRTKAALCGMLGQPEEGQKYIQRLLAVTPDATIAVLRRLLLRLIKSKALVERMIDGLRKAGLPE
jgi:adenylate cyclase